MTKGRQTLVWVKTFSKTDKAAIAITCGRFIDEVLKPRFQPDIRSTEFNFPINIIGKWRGDRYSFIQRYRSGFADNAGEEFDHAFARLDHVSGDLFDLMWHRHTGQWLCLRNSITLSDSLLIMEGERLVQPIPR